MHKKIFLLAFLLCSTISFSQEIINSTPLGLKRNKAIFQIANDSTKETTLLVSDKEIVKGYRLNKEMQITDSLSTERLNPKIYVAMIGYTESKSNINLFWNSSNHKEIFIQKFNFNRANSENKNYSLSLKDEKFIQNFSQNGKFYILTVLKNSDTLKLYIFDNDGELEERTIDLTGFKFYTSDYQKTTLYGMLEESFFATEAPFSLQKITPENPTSLVQSSKRRKCYSIENTIVLSFDSNIDYTQLITLDLDKFKANEKFIKKPFIGYTKRNEINSNSFLIDHQLFQIKCSSNQLILTIKDLEDNLVKSYEATDETPIIDFKNTNYIQENGGTTKTRILDTSSQFIRKTNNLNTGISCYKLDDNYLVTIGCISQEQQSSTGVIVGGMFGALGSIAGSLIEAAISNPTMENFNSYANRKVVYINGLFDKEGNHLKGEINPLAFDKIRAFFDKNSNVSSQTLYKLDKNYYLGYYDNETKEYIIRIFKD